MGDNGHVRWQTQPLYHATEQGAIAFVRAGYLKELHKRGHRMQRRQDVHPQHFLTAEEVRKQALFSVSYKWMSPDHPDPRGVHLERLVHVLADEKADDDDGVFLDFSSMHQRPRDELQQALFVKGQQIMIAFQSNFRVACIVLPDVPPDVPGASFWQSGWRYQEFLMISMCQRIVNLKDPTVGEHMVPEWLVDYKKRLHDPNLLQFPHRPDARRVERGIENWASEMPSARFDAVGFVVTCAVANFRFVRCHYLRQLAVRGGPSPRRQDLPRGTFVDGHVPAGGTLWVLSYRWFRSDTSQPSWRESAGAGPRVGQVRRV